MPFVELKPHKESGGMIRSRRPQVPARPAPARHGGGSCGRPCARRSGPAAAQPSRLFLRALTSVSPGRDRRETGNPDSFETKLSRLAESWETEGRPGG